MALLALPVGVAHGEPAFSSCLAAALPPSWHEQKSSSHHMVLQSIRKAAEGPFSPSWGQLALQRRYALPMGEYETWAILAAGETAAASQLGLRPGAAAAGWQCPSEDGYLQTSVALG